uniref:E3 ubiquitin-protein ligase n=1 Tax=Panagrolaimus davidi TaxID=227884 RepID=A0A914QN28_9BILA
MVAQLLQELPPASREGGKVAERIVHISVQICSGSNICSWLQKEINIIQCVLRSAIMMSVYKSRPLQINHSPVRFYSSTPGDFILRFSSEYLVVAIEENPFYEKNADLFVLTDSQNLLVHQPIAKTIFNSETLIEMYMRHIELFQGFTTEWRIVSGDHRTHDWIVSAQRSYNVEFEACSLPMHNLLQHATTPKDCEYFYKHVLESLNTWFKAIKLDKSPTDTNTPPYCITFHIPLHRHLATLIFQMQTHHCTGLLNQLTKDEAFLRKCILHPIRIHVARAQFYAGMWLRNGQGMRIALPYHITKFKQKLLNKSSDLYSNTLSIIDKLEAEKNWIKENTNESILSLHISVYENSLEAAAFDSINAKNDALKWNKIKLNKLFSSGLFVQNPFEFPRQQEANQKKELEVMKFKANQKLLNPVQTTPSKNVQITNSAPAQMPISSNNNKNENININVQPGSFNPQSFTPEPIDPSIPLPSQEILRDLSKETELIRASDEKSADINADEYYKYFWCLKLSVRVKRISGYFSGTNLIQLLFFQKVATNFSIFLLFFDLFNISLAFRIEYLNYQLLYILSIFGPLALIFGVNVETYFNFAFVTAYFATIIRIIINGILIWIYYDKMLDSRDTEEKFQRFLNMATHENLTDKFEELPPHRNSNLFRTIYPFTVLMGICGIMILLQIWALAVAIPRSHSWIKKKGTHVKK